MTEEDDDEEKPLGSGCEQQVWKEVKQLHLSVTLLLSFVAITSL